MHLFREVFQEKIITGMNLSCSIEIRQEKERKREWFRRTNGTEIVHSS